MQEALPYKTWTSSFPMKHKDTKTTNPVITKGASIKDDDMKHMVSENPVIVFGRQGCCMIHVVKRLLQGLGVNPTVYEIDEHSEKDVTRELQMIDHDDDNDVNQFQFPAVFIGGRLFGGLDRVMATHITGELIPVLKQARALWL